MNDITIIPPYDELDHLPTPLTPGERKTLEFFREHLPDGWELYVQPHLNGLRPDFVLLHPDNGIAVYEVKDWDLDALDYFFQGTPPTLHGRRDGKTFSLARQNPIAKVIAYKDEVHKLYCPSLPVRTGFGVITAGVVFPFASREKADHLLGTTYKTHLSIPQNPMVCWDDLDSGNILKAFPLVHRHNEYMSHDIAAELRPWLVEPDVSVEQRHPLEMDKKQIALATDPAPQKGYRRIKGAAGSGKSVVLAARAAELAKEGKTVLVATFNITLLNYLRDLAVRWWRSKTFAERITWLNFHQWCKRITATAGENDKQKSLWENDDYSKDEILNEKMAELVFGLYQREGAELPQYDAILVDEGQDYRLSWWKALRAACKPGGEMLLVADPTQDVYGTARAWTEQKMIGAGFSGRWTTLDTSYRLPPVLIPLVRDFAERFLPRDGLRALPQPAQTELALSSTHLRWFQVRGDRAEDACVAEVLALPRSIGGKTLPWSDVTFLTSSRALGARVVNRLEGHGIHVLHTFYEGEEERRHKLAFFKGSAKVKATTIHSFKGWEGRALVIHFGDLLDDKMKAAAYAALTRLKRHKEACVLSVVCSWDEGEEYGRSWPSFHSWRGDGLGTTTEVLEDFSAVWKPVMVALAATEGVTVDPGEEIMNRGRVVDLDLATVCWKNRKLRLVDDVLPSANEVASTLTSQGWRVVRVRATDPDVVMRVMGALEE
ncbi:MAG: AAA family ATPase [Proteobacteria bacterium]|jgi:hypothetical protein|nr:AAA family ATPase [Pseudomonadota bacterium]